MTTKFLPCSENPPSHVHRCYVADWMQWIYIWMLGFKKFTRQKPIVSNMKQEGRRFQCITPWSVFIKRREWRWIFVGCYILLVNAGMAGGQLAANMGPFQLQHAFCIVWGLLGTYYRNSLCISREWECHLLFLVFKNILGCISLFLRMYIGWHLNQMSIPLILS